jgi:signal transduction histidine kinase
MIMADRDLVAPKVGGESAFPGPVVLVVDDEPGILRQCKRLLERAGLQAIAVADPGEGLEILEHNPVDLLLVDVLMPDMDGFELIDRALSWQPDLAIVVMTGFGTIEVAAEALRKGADGLVLKPFPEGKELVETVLQALQENRRKRDFVRLQALRPLFELSRVLFSQTELGSLQELILDVVIEHFQCSNAALFQRELSQGEVQLSAVRGRTAFQEKLLPGGEEQEQRIWEHPALANRHGSVGERGQALPPAEDLESMMSVPVAGREYDTLLVAAREQGEQPFSSADLEVFSLLAQQAATALENTRLYAELLSSIDQLKESQQALILAEKVATAGRLTVSIAHEINNPLQAVHNCLHLAGRKELSPELRESYLELAQVEMNRLMETVQRMLDYYRPGRLERNPTDVNDVIHRVVKLLDHQLKDHAIDTRLDLSPDLPRPYLVKDQIQQVIINIVLNSIDAMPSGGELYLKTSREQDSLQVLIEDSGPGISEEERSRIFEPFVSRKEAGVGLGLPISAGIVAAHGGQLELLTERGKGACFRVLLPVGEI